MKFESIELNFYSLASNQIFVVKNKYGMCEKYVLYSNLCLIFLFVPKFDADTYLMSQDLTATNIVHFSWCNINHYTN